MAAEPEVTEGDRALSRQQHARDALELLGNMDWVVGVLTREIDDPDEQRWFHDVVAGVAALAFVAGRHMQAAWGKPIEHLAASREKQLLGLRERNEGRAEYNAKRRRETEEGKRKAREIAAKSSLKGMALASYVATQLAKPENGGITRTPKTIHRWLTKP